MAARERMSSADAAWLHMDRPTNLMVITAVLWFEAPVDWASLREVVRLRLVERFPRFRQRAVESGLPLLGPSWEDDEHFDLDLHFHHIALPAPADTGVLQALVADLMAIPLDRSKPLWHFHLVDGYRDGCAIVVRIHHCIADGIALARVLLSLTDTQPDAGLGPADDGRRPHGSGPMSALAGAAGSVLSAGRGLAGALLHEGLEIATDPGELLHLASVARQDAGTLAKFLLTGRESPSVLKGDLGLARRVAWIDPVPLDRISAIAHAAQATVNDVVLAGVTGALHRYLKRRDSLVEELRAVVPFNLRPLDQPLPRTLGNRFGLVFLPLPVGLPEPTERLAGVKRAMDQIKRSPEGALFYGVLSFAGLTPPQAEKLLVDLFSARGTGVMTNLPGPRETVYLAGAPVSGVLFWAPSSGSLSMTISIFSYAGRVLFGLATNARLVPDPEAIVQELERELHELGAQVGAAV